MAKNKKCTAYTVRTYICSATKCAFFDKIIYERMPVTALQTVKPVFHLHIVNEANIYLALNFAQVW